MSARDCDHEWSPNPLNCEFACCALCGAERRDDSVTGVKLDKGKRPWHLVPWRAMGLVVDVLAFGAAKYSEWNWHKVPRARERYFDAAQRHLLAWLGGEQDDPESHLPHLAHCTCCCLFLLALEVGDTGA